MIACICGGVVEISLLVAVVTVVSAWITNRYNRFKCRKHGCKHRGAKESDVVDAVFLKYYRGGIFAAFPGIPHSNGSKDHILAYCSERRETHSWLKYCNDCEEATRSEYTDLLEELRRRGYNIYVVSKSRIYDVKYSKMRQAYNRRREGQPRRR